MTYVYEMDLRDALHRVQVLQKACELTVREMEAYYRDGHHPDLSVILKACRKALEETS